MTRKPVTPTVWVGAVAALALLATTATVRTEDARTPRTAAEFDAMFREINNWRRWGAGDELGTMNLVTAQKVREAAALVRRGITVSLSHNPMRDEAPDNPAGSFMHTMGPSRRTDTYEFTYHGYGVSHMDSLCHFLWNDRRGASRLSAAMRRPT